MRIVFLAGMLALQGCAHTTLTQRPEVADHCDARFCNVGKVVVWETITPEVLMVVNEPR